MARNNGDGTFTLSYDEYDKIQGDLYWLACLEAAGVDNWEGCDVARAMQRGEEAY